MNSTTQRTRNSQSGYTMAEILVATAIFAVIIVAALLVYDRSNRVFKSSLESSDVQQNARVAFNRLVADVRMAGFDFDRDGIPTGASIDTRVNSRIYPVGAVIDAGGNLYRATTGGQTAASAPTFNTAIGAVTNDGAVKWTRIAGGNQYQQPDEQIEFAGRTVIAIRGNLDYETDAANEHGREADYEPAGGQFPVVTTGNDEIVTYALVSRDTTKNDNSISFWADVAKPRASFPGGSAETSVTISGIDTDLDAQGMPANPPYTLQRITLKDDGSLNRTPVAENIRSVRFTYFEDQAGNVPLRDLANANIPTSGVAMNTGIIGGDGKYDPASSAAVPQREIRKKIRAVRLELIGMSPFPDRAYTNPDETIEALKRYRTYGLATTIVPRNLGKHGMREQSVEEPGPPTLTRVCRAGCGVLHLEWDAPKVTAQFGAAEQYQVEWGQMVSGTVAWTGNQSFGSALEGSVAGLDPTKTWYVQVKAINTYGSNTSEPLSLQPLNMTKPLPPANVVATTDQIGRIAVSWDEVAGNVTGVSQNCTTGTLSGDQVRNRTELMYKVWRNTENNAAGTSGVVTQLWTGTGPAGPYTGTGPEYDAASAKFVFVDDTVPNCTNYFYFVEAIDRLCFADINTNSPNDLGTAKSGPSAGAQGTAVAGDKKPLAPENLVVDSTSACNPAATGAPCSVTLKWPRVTADEAGNKIAVSQYVVKTVRKKLSDNSTVDTVESAVTADPTQSTVSWTSAKSKKNAAGDEIYFEFQVAARQCDPPLQSAYIPDPPLKWPCPWSAGTVNVSVAGTPYDGDGLSLATAWTVTDPASVSLTTASPLKKATAVFRVISPTPVAFDAQVQENPTSSTLTFNIPGNPTNGQMWQVDFELTDANGCTQQTSRWIFDSPTSCCLLPTFFDGNLISGDSRNITVTLANICDKPITLENPAIKITWNTAVQKKIKLATMQWPGVTGTTSVNSNTASLSFNLPSGATTVIPANSSTYKVKFTWDANITTSVLQKMCVGYRLEGAASASQCMVVSPTTTGLNTCQ